MSNGSQYLPAKPRERAWLAIPTKRRGRKREMVSLAIMLAALLAWLVGVIYLVIEAARGLAAIL